MGPGDSQKLIKNYPTGNAASFVVSKTCPNESHFGGTTNFLLKFLDPPFLVTKPLFGTCAIYFHYGITVTSISSLVGYVIVASLGEKYLFYELKCHEAVGNSHQIIFCKEIQKKSSDRPSRFLFCNAKNKIKKSLNESMDGMIPFLQKIFPNLPVFLLRGHRLFCNTRISAQKIPR